MPKKAPESLVLAIDIGTSSTRTALFDERGRRLPATTAAEQYSVDYGSDGRAELSPFVLLRALTRASNRTLRAYRSLPPTKRLPIGLVSGSALWHGLLGLDRQFRPLTSVFTWADSRARDDAVRLRERFSERRIQQRTGCMLRATFWPAKLHWLRRTQSTLFRQVAYWVSPSDWLFRSMFGELKSSASMASATGLFDLKKTAWDAQLLDACGIRLKTLPVIAEKLAPGSSTSVQPEYLFCPIGDGAASNLGSGANHPFVAAVNVGTSAAVRTIQDHKSAVGKNLPNGLFRYVVDRSRFLAGGAISNAGNLRQWCLRELRINPDPKTQERALSRQAAATESLTLLPFWVEERAPTWPEGQFGVIDGLSQSTTAEQIVRAAATAVFYRLSQVLAELEDWLGQMQRIIVSGGILQSTASLQLLADCLGRQLEVSAEPEASLRGAAVHALTQRGIEVETPPSGKIVKHVPALAALHQERRERQIRLERLLRSR